MLEVIASVTEIVRDTVRFVGVVSRRVPWYLPLAIVALFMVVS
jgi:hypothetical protein